MTRPRPKRLSLSAYDAEHVYTWLRMYWRDDTQKPRTCRETLTMRSNRVPVSDCLQAFGFQLFGTWDLRGLATAAILLIGGSPHERHHFPT